MRGGHPDGVAPVGVGAPSPPATRDHGEQRQAAQGLGGPSTAVIVARHACAPCEDRSNGGISEIRCWAEFNPIFAVDSEYSSESWTPGYAKTHMFYCLFCTIL